MRRDGTARAETQAANPLGQTFATGRAHAEHEPARRAAQADPETQKRLAAAYIDPLPMSPPETASALAVEHERLGKLIQQLGIKADGT